MAVAKLLGLLLTLQLMISAVSTARINGRQLDIPAFKAFFSQIQSHLGNDKDQGSTGTGAVSVKIEGLKPPPVVSPDLGVNTTLKKSVVSGNDLKFGMNVLRDSKSNNTNFHSHPDGMMKGVFFPVPPMVKTKEIESDFDFRPISSSFFGSSVTNSQPASGSVTSNKGTLGGKSEHLSLYSNHRAPTQPLQFHKNPSSSVVRSHPASHSSQIPPNQATRALPIQGSTNVLSTSITMSNNDWIPMSQPGLNSQNGLPFTTSYDYPSTSIPPHSKDPFFQDFDGFTLFDGQSTEGKSNKKKKEIIITGSTASEDSNDVVDNHSDPSFLTAFRLIKPEIEQPLYGQVVAPPMKNYPPARNPVPKPVYKAPLNINQIIAEAVDPKPPIQHGYKASKYSIKEKLKSNLQSVLKTGINPVDPSFRFLKDLHSPVKNNFDDGYRDGVGKVSSFSYFRNQGPNTPGSKGFDQAFNIHAGRNIDQQFKQHMFDQTGFPGKIP